MSYESGLFADPPELAVPTVPGHWTADQLLSGLFSSAKLGDWEAVYRVVYALVERGHVGEHGPLRAMVVSVLDQHEPQRVYGECRHHHEEDDDGNVPAGVFWLGGLEEYVCEDGYAETACKVCGLDGDGELVSGGIWPCPTFKPMADRLIEVLAVST